MAIRREFLSKLLNKIESGRKIKRKKKQYAIVHNITAAAKAHIRQLNENPKIIQKKEEIYVYVISDSHSN